MSEEEAVRQLDPDETGELAMEWLASHDHRLFYDENKPDHVDVKHYKNPKVLLYTCSFDDDYNQEAEKEFRRGHYNDDLFKLFAMEIKSNTKLICQLEYIVRGVWQSITQHRAIPDFIRLLNDFNPTYLESSGEKLVTIVRDSDSLVKLGANLILSYMQPVVILVGPKICAIVHLLVELAETVGFPPDFVKIIPADYKENDPTSLTAPMSMEYATCVVFEDVDLDVAAEGIYNAVWGYESTIFKTRNIFVEKGIREPLLKKLEELAKSHPIVVNFVRGTIYTARISYEFRQREDVQLIHIDNTYIIYPRGDKVEVNRNVESAILSVRLFRSIDEVVKNIAHDGFTNCGIWTENTSDQFNELSTKLFCWHIWWNHCYGEFNSKFYLSKQYFDFDKVRRNNWASVSINARIKRMKMLMDHVTLDDQIVQTLLKLFYINFEGTIQYARSLVIDKDQQHIPYDNKLETFYSTIGKVTVEEDVTESEALEILLMALLLGDIIILAEEHENTRRLQVMHAYFYESVVIMPSDEINFRTTHVVYSTEHLLYLSQWKNIWTPRYAAILT